ncbi:MAG TPA: AraC family transcriptional regulator [Cytophagales bacterium]|nr:AraC family transcriptional regulator [Cytophagales bacterium]HAA22640.1 AraC family transcriptional regulator [Cytophagales bacterium]HAP62228.1 AraC family transcriptional regulator [Cytophagales bacterium]
MADLIRVKSISEFHSLVGMPVPDHPLISLITDDMLPPFDQIDDSLINVRYTSDMYSIMYKDKVSGSLGYGRNTYDFQEGTLVFLSPGQVYESPSREDLQVKEGWTLMFHPDLLRKSALGKKMEEYTFFSYAVNEALHLSPKEETFCLELSQKIREECAQNQDQHSQTLIISTLELLLNYCMRFYDRQFYSRTNINKDFVVSFEGALKNFFQSNQVAEVGLPSTDFFGQALNMSTNYLSDMLKKETGKSIKEHIDGYVVDRAKSILLNSSQKVSEIAYGLGFDYPQSFTRLFKNKTGMSPAEYRSLN